MRLAHATLATVLATSTTGAVAQKQLAPLTLEALVADNAVLQRNQPLTITGTAAPDERYCWGDAPLCNLYDTAALPVGPFERAISD